MIRFFPFAAWMFAIVSQHSPSSSQVTDETPSQNAPTQKKAPSTPEEPSSQESPPCQKMNEGERRMLEETSDQDFNQT
ncbi:MAG: hypothetical protein KGI80_00170 [Verrucomicrobiota bacterium]|nr:hypothetical protein [Verrucomicrobiota bacterium]